MDQNIVDWWTAAGILLIVAGMWAHYCHCFFFFHSWDCSRKTSDLCIKCGAIRFKEPFA